MKTVFFTSPICFVIIYVFLFVYFLELRKKGDFNWSGNILNKTPVWLNLVICCFFACLFSLFLTFLIFHGDAFQVLDQDALKKIIDNSQK